MALDLFTMLRFMVGHQNGSSSTTSRPNHAI
jgi:hypothetical protein